MPKNDFEGRTHFLRLGCCVSKIVLKLYPHSYQHQEKPRTETERDLTLTDCIQVEIIFYMDVKYVIRDLKFPEHEKRNFVSPSGHVMFYLLYKHQWNTKTIFVVKKRDLLCSHSNGDLFTCEGNMFFHMWRYHAFARELTWYFIGVYIIK